MGVVILDQFHNTIHKLFKFVDFCADRYANNSLQISANSAANHNLYCGL